MSEKHWIFADGACSGNPGPGGWGAILITAQGEVTELGGFDRNTTNNQMELQAVIEAFRKLGPRPGGVRVFTDSVYVIRGITSWIYGWQRNGWKTAEGADVANRDYWMTLSLLVQGRKSLGELSWEYVRGHTGVVGNERCDQIAVSFSKGEATTLYSGSEKSYEENIRKIPCDTSLPVSSEKGAAAKAEAGYPIYLSLVGRSLEKHKTWLECEARVKGTSGAKFKKVISKSEEDKILKSWGV